MNRKAMKAFILIIALMVSLISCEQSQAAPKTFLSVATATTGGTFFIVGAKIAEMISKYIPDVQATAEVTAGGVENARIMDSGNCDIAFMPGDTLRNAVNGIGEFESDGPIDLQIITAIYATPLQAVVLESSGIKSIPDLKGKKVSIGPPGSSSAVRAEIVLNAYGMTLDDIILDYTASTEAATQLGDGLIDAAFFASGAPQSAIMEVATKFQIALLPVSDEAVVKVKEIQPALDVTIVPANTYPGVPETRCVCELSGLSASSRMSEELGYQITKMLFEHMDEFKTSHKAVADEFKVETAASQGHVAPYHPGAIRYYKEIGAM